MEIKVSIVTVCFNAEKTIRRTIESVLSQSYQNFELIIVDGCSFDNTVSIIREYISDDRISLISEPDDGLYDAMNKGIRFSTGDIIGMLNSDDFYSSYRSLELIVKPFCSLKDIDGVYGDVIYIDKSKIGSIKRHYSSKYFRRILFVIGMMPPHPTVYLRRDIFVKFGYYSLDYKIVSDFDFLLRVMYLEKINTIYIPSILVVMQLGGLSSSGFKSVFDLNREIVQSCRKNNVYTNKCLVWLKYIFKIFEWRYVLFNKSYNDLLRRPR